MATQSPFSWLAQGMRHWQPPAWVLDETQHRLVLFLNHMLMAESEARQRLARQKGRCIEVRWQDHRLQLQATPAGLFDRSNLAQADLRLTLTDASPLDWVSAMARGAKPAVHIEGDVQLAAEVNWLIDHLRWDVEEDLSRLIGDAPAHTLAQLARQTLTALGDFVTRQRERRAGAAA